jgi:hypothetical protein
MRVESRRRDKGLLMWPCHVQRRDKRQTIQDPWNRDRMGIRKTPSLEVVNLHGEGKGVN